MVLSKHEVKGVDRPPYWARPSALHFQCPLETQVSLTRFSKEGRTIRPLGPNRPLLAETNMAPFMPFRVILVIE